ncbi:hypothetical protein OC861_006841 [Tilletia horrida]|nr:hypothetical protein OC861_006841 [Tilletia horrida]
MFGGGGTGGGGFGGFGQQQQPQAGTFGASQPAQTAFGFGAQQPQPQQTGGLFGNSGAPSQPFAFGAASNSATNNATGAGGGLFGAQQSKPATTSFGFGSNNATTSGGSFGFGTGGTAMQPAQQQTSSIFGAGSTAGGAFGAKPATTGLFGAQQAQTGTFGAANNGNAGIFGAAGGATPMPTQGSSNPPYQPHVVSEKDNNGQSSQFSYQSITCLPAYRGVSFEELRVQDYQQGRKTGTAGPSAGGAFGGLGQQPGQGSGAFGQPGTAGGLFGQAGQQGAAAASQNPFGQQSNGLFGTQPAAGGGAFGQQQQQQQPAGGLFGGSKPGGLFGQTPAPPASGGLFGQQAQQQQQQQGAFGFGTAGSQQSTAGTSTFGFGAGATNQPKPGGIFGATTNAAGFGTALGQTPAQSQTGGFGATQAQNNTGTTAGWSFGAANNAAKPGGLFSNTTTAPTPTGAFAFGATSGAAATQTKPAFSFGNAAASTSAPNAFGSNMTAAGQPAAGGGLLGTSTAGFSAGTTTATPATSGGIFGAGTSFGAKPAAGGLFGSNQVQLAGATGGSLFGASTAAPTSGASDWSDGWPVRSTTFDAQGPAAAGTNAFGTNGGGLFGSNTQAKPGGLSEAGGNAGEGLFGNRNHAGTGASGPFGTGPTGADVAASFGAVTTSASQNAGAVSSPFRPTPRSSGKTLRYRSATPSLGLLSGTASVGAGTARGGTPGLSGPVGVREVSVLSSSPAAQRIGSPSIFRALSNESTDLPSQAFTVRPNVKRLILTDGGAASIAGSPSASRSILSQQPATHDMIFKQSDSTASHYASLRPTKASPTGRGPADTAASGAKTSSIETAPSGSASGSGMPAAKRTKLKNQQARQFRSEVPSAPLSILAQPKYAPSSVSRTSTLFSKPQAVDLNTPTKGVYLFTKTDKLQG